MSVFINFSTFDELPAIAEIHKFAFPNSFSTKLGKKYRQKMLEWYLSNEKTFMLTAKTETGEIIAYITGMVRDGSFKTGSSSAMAQYSFNTAVISFLCRPWLFFHPEVRKKYKFILSNISRRLFKNNGKSKIDNNKGNEIKKSVGLVTMGVLPNYLRQGVGTALMLECEKVAAQKYKIADLHFSVEEKNLGAIRVYEKIGWVRQKHEGTAYRYSKTISI